jgi:hypothetical protein
MGWVDKQQAYISGPVNPAEGRYKMTIEEAKKSGYRVIRGNFTNTTDDRADRWYLDNLNSNIIDKRGAGFETCQDALDTLAQRLGSHEEG